MAAADRPTGDVTFLFTDIEGSTRLVDTLGTAAWRPILARHREIIRAALAANGGFENQVEGDGFFAAFEDPLAATASVADMQRALAAEPWPDGTSIRVRMGLHTGLGELDADGAYVGHDVHRAARVAAAGHGGQVLLSEATATLVEGRLPAGLTIRPFGAHRLKDLRPERIAQLVIDGLPADFPPIRSLDARPNNLPTELTSFVGRERELEETRALLGDDPPADAHGSRRHRQDAAGAAGRGRPRRRVPGRGVVRAARDHHEPGAGGAGDRARHGDRRRPGPQPDRRARDRARDEAGADRPRQSRAGPRRRRRHR